MLKDEKVKMVDQWLDEALKTPPGFTLPDDFARKVTDRMSISIAWRQYFKEFLIYLGVIAGTAAVAIAMAFIWLGADGQEWQRFLENNLSWITGVNVLGLFVLFADRVLLRYFFFRFSRESLS